MTTVIITRPVPAMEQTASVYNNAGFDVFKSPCFDIKTNTSVQPQWLNQSSDVWIVLSVNALYHALIINPSLRPSDDTQVIAVGPAVATAWAKHFDHPINHHPLMNSEGVIELAKELKPSSLKILTTSDGRELIKEYCMHKKISYSQINTYVRVPLSIKVDDWLHLYHSKENIFLTATSSDILTQVYAGMTESLKSKVLAKPIVVGAIRIAELAEEIGFKSIILASSPSTEDMCKEIINQTNLH